MPHKIIPNHAVQLQNFPSAPRVTSVLTHLIEGGGEIGDQRGVTGADLRPQAVGVAQHRSLVEGLRRRQLAVVTAQVHVLAAHPDVRLAGVGPKVRNRVRAQR